MIMMANHFLHKFAMVPAFAAMICVSTASAQNNKKPTGEAASRKEAEKVMQEFAICVLKSKKTEAAVVAFLGLPDGDPRQNSDGPKLAVSKCAPHDTEMRFKPDLLSRSLYNALYRKYYGKSGPGNLAASQTKDYRLEYDTSAVPVSEGQIALRSFADCSVMQNPVAAHDFILSNPSSVGEAAALPPVLATMQRCISEGSELKFSRTILKGLLAESLYKMRKQTAGQSDAVVVQKAPS